MPRLIGGGDGDGHRGAHRDVPQGVGVVGVGEGVGGEDNLVRPDGRCGGGLDHLVHHQRHGAADGEGAVHDGAQHVHAGLGIAGGVPVVEVVCIEVDAAGGDPGLVDAGHRADDVREVPAAVRTLIAQVGGDGESGLADDSRAILPETHGVVAAVAAEDLSLRHQDADGQAVGGVEEVAVDARHHPVALALQCPGRRGDRGAGGQGVPEGDDGRHICIGLVCDDVLRPQVGVRSTPKHIGRELGLLVQKSALGGQRPWPRTRRR